MYREAQGFMIAALAPGNGKRVISREPLVADGFVSNSHTNYDIAPDGRLLVRFSNSTTRACSPKAPAMAA